MGKEFDIIAHGVNTPEQMSLALNSTADWIEHDIWPKQGIAVHFGPFGVLGIGTPVEHLLDHSGNSHKGIVLDFKSRAKLNPDLAKNIVEKFLQNGNQKIAATSIDWETLIWLNQNFQVDIFFGISNQRDLKNFFRNLPDQSIDYGGGVSIRYTLLSEQIVRELKMRRLKVWAWSVNNSETAKELLSWGVDGVISDEFNLKLKLKSAV